MGDHKAMQRGGQPNNTNAYKHGFYSKHYSDFENQALFEITLADVTDKIDNLRVTTARFMEAYYTSLDEQDYASRLTGLRAISLAAGSIAGLVRLQAFAPQKGEEAKPSVCMDESERIMESPENTGLNYSFRFVPGNEYPQSPHSFLFWRISDSGRIRKSEACALSSVHLCNSGCVGRAHVGAPISRCLYPYRPHRPVQNFYLG